MAISIAVIILLGLLSDHVFRGWFRIPGLVGMLLTGILLGPYELNVIDHVILTVSSDFRMIALIVVIGAAILLTWVEKTLRPYVFVSSLSGVIAIGFIILEKSEPLAHKISQKLGKIWVFAEIHLFVLVGTGKCPCCLECRACRNSTHPCGPCHRKHRHIYFALHERFKPPRDPLLHRLGKTGGEGFWKGITTSQMAHYVGAMYLFYNKGVYGEII